MNQPSTPTDSQINRGWWWLLAVIWAAFMMLGSWYPFEYTPASLQDAWDVWRVSGGWVKQGRSDLAVNLLLGLPLGFFGCLALLPQGKTWSLWRLAAPMFVLLFVAFWAIVVELGQRFFGYRVPSQADTAAQLLGGFLGATIAWFGGAWISHRVATLVSQNPERSTMSALLDLYVAGYIFWMLMPFLPVSPSELAMKWRSGNIQLSPLATWLSDPYRAAYTWAVALVTAIPVGMAVAFHWRNHAPKVHPATAALVAALGVILLEFAQVFVQTRTAALDDAIGSAIGAVLGAWAFIAFVSNAKEGTLAGSNTGPLLAASAVLFAIAYVLVAWAPFDFADTSGEIRERLKLFRTQSFRSWLMGDDMGHASNLIRSILWSAPLGGLAGMAIQASGRKNGCFWLVAAVFCVLVCCAAEGSTLR